jgi:hypothetical protein
MRFSTGKDFLNWPHKAVTVLGMSGVGKTTFAQLLQDHELVPLFGRLPHRHEIHGRAHRRQFQARGHEEPLPARTAASDSIHIRSNITFDNLKPLSTYLGKARQSGQGRHQLCRIQAPPASTAKPRSLAAGCAGFIEKARDIYQYGNFVCDSGGSLCEVVDPRQSGRPGPPVSPEHAAALYRGNARTHPHAGGAFPQIPEAHVLSAAVPRAKWAEYKALNEIRKRRRRRSRWLCRLGLRAAPASPHPALQGDCRQLRLHGSNA